MNLLCRQALAARLHNRLPQLERYAMDEKHAPEKEQRTGDGISTSLVQQWHDDLERVAREMGKLIDDINYGPVRECRGEAKDPIQKWDEALSQLKAPTFLNVERMEDPERKSGAAVDRRERAKVKMSDVMDLLDRFADDNPDLSAFSVSYEYGTRRLSIAIKPLESSGGGEKP